MRGKVFQGNRLPYGQKQKPTPAPVTRLECFIRYTHRHKVKGTSHTPSTSPISLAPEANTGFDLSLDK